MDRERYSRRKFLKYLIGAGSAAAAVTTRSSFTPSNKRSKDLMSFFISLFADSEKKPASYADYAGLFYEAMRENFLVINGLYKEESPNFIPFQYASNWPFSRAMSATIDMYVITKNEKYGRLLVSEIQGLKSYLDQPESSEASGYNSTVQSIFNFSNEKFYDDNAWVGLNLIRVYKMTENKEVFEMIKKIFDFIETGYDVSAPCAPGGQFWKQQTSLERNHDRNTVSSLPTARIAVFLYEKTGEKRYLEEAEKRSEWVKKNLQDPVDGLNKDKIMGNCDIDQKKWTYNQNFLIEPENEQVAYTALSHFADKYFDQDPAFNAIFFRNLIALSMAMGKPDLLLKTKTAMEKYAKDAVSNPLIYDRERYLFRFKGDQSAKLINQAAMVQIFAMLACPPEKYPYLVY